MSVQQNILYDRSHHYKLLGCSSAVKAGEEEEDLISKSMNESQRCFQSSHCLCPGLLTILSFGFIFIDTMSAKYLKIFKYSKRYSPLRGLTSSSCRGLQPSAKGFYCPSGKKTAFNAICDNFRPFLVFSIKKKYENPKKSIKNLKKCQPSKKVQKKSLKKNPKQI